MKPVPFAQYLARQQRTAPAAPEPVVWPPMPDGGEKATFEDRLAARQSPLLRPVEARRKDEPKEPNRLDQGHLRAFEEGRAAAQKELDDERAKMRDAVAEQIAEARKNWRAEEAERLAEAHRAAFAAFETRCAQAVTNILRPFLIGAVIGKVTESLVQNLEILFAARDRALFEISGPADLLEALREKFAERDAVIVFKPNAGIDVCVRVDDTVIETQLAPWMQALGALSKGGADD